MPTPPVPMRVSSRVPTSRSLTAVISRARPTKLVSCTGRLCGSAVDDSVLPVVEAALGPREGGGGATRKRARSSPGRVSAPASRWRVSRTGRFSPRSSPWMLRTPSPARSASASWVSPAASLCSLSRSANVLSTCATMLPFSLDLQLRAALRCHPAAALHGTASEYGTTPGLSRSSLLPSGLYQRYVHPRWRPFRCEVPAPS